jgi:type IV pilus assembly protein PilA
MKRIQKGFTLIELMIVVAIIGILAAVAIPAYQDYIVKAKLSKVASTVDPLKLALAMYYQTNGSWPNSAATVITTATGNVTSDVWYTSLGLTSYPTLPNEVSQLALSSNGSIATIALTLTNIKGSTVVIDGSTLTMTGTPGSTSVSWSNTCASRNSVLDAYYTC